MLTLHAFLRRMLAQPNMNEVPGRFEAIVGALENADGSPETLAPVVRLALEAMLSYSHNIAPADKGSIVDHVIDLLLQDLNKAEGGPIERLTYSNLTLAVKNEE